MKYELSFCEIEQLSENVFEAKSKAGVVLDEKCVEEGWNFWNDLRDRPYGLLINCEVPYNLSFIGARDIGKHQLQHKTAIFCNDETGELQKGMKVALNIKQFDGDYSRKIFSDREEAIKWLSDIPVLPKEAPKKYQLTNCQIEQLSDNIFEGTPKVGIVVDKECVDECWKHWEETRQEPFGLLINCKNSFSFSFEGAKDTYNHPLQQKTAILADEKDYETEKNIIFVLRVKEMAGLFLNCQIFTDRTQAIKWLSDI